MRTGPIVALVLMAALAPPLVRPTDAQDRSRRRQSERETQTERINRTFNIGSDGEIDVGNISGDIVITRGGGNSATIDIVKTARAETVDEARTILPLVTVDIAERGSRIEIKTRYPRHDEMRGGSRRNMNVDVAFAIVAPANTRIVARSISGNVSVRDISGSVTIESVSGNLKIENGGRIVNGKTISGNVDLTDTRVDGALSVGSISGSVKIQRSRMDSLNATSVSGDVILDEVESNRVDAQVISGNVSFSGDLEPNGRYELTSHSGNVQLTVGAKTGFQIEATSFSGGITTDLPLTLQGEGRRRGTLRAKYGNGSALVDLTSFSGSIRIAKR